MPKGVTRTSLATEFSLKRSDYGMKTFIPMVSDEIKLMVGIEGIRSKSVFLMSKQRWHGSPDSRGKSYTPQPENKRLGRAVPPVKLFYLHVWGRR